MRPYTKAERVASRWKPENAVLHEQSDTGGCVYLYEKPLPFAPGSDYLAIGYAGTAGRRAFHIRFKTQEARTAYVEKFFQNLAASKTFKQELRQRFINKPTTLQIGDIVTNSWGYDQTNVDWYTVVRKTEHFVWLSPIESELTSDGNLSMTGYSVPTMKDGRPVIVEERQILKHKSCEDRVTMRHGSAQKWDGRKRFVSWYA